MKKLDSARLRWSATGSLIFQALIRKEGDSLAPPALPYGCGGGDRSSIDLPTDRPLSNLDLQAALLDSEGEAIRVVLWGWNQRSQLGKVGSGKIPSEVEGLDEEDPVSVSGGRVHSIAITFKDEVWVWGCGKNGRLGLGSFVDETEPILLDSLEGYDVLQAVCSFDHHLVK
ncbi:uncharacterized protein LOC126657255 [Mercurialis annua]|uniref:uncharacterized protein LOC126657255 n=1 Tax=Mercurialis annua TaxID=3986 RepID=UPI00215F617B|nr:uncharacterized protein LOC126657255 [Mercurialis annua]